MRVVVVGTSGAGKSTFAAALAQATDSPYIELDALYWGPGWAAVPHEQFEARVREATEGDCWVADGTYTAVRELLWARATHVVWLNYGRATVFPRVLWRTLSRGLLRTQLAHGNRESLRMTFFSRESVLWWSVSTFARNQVKFAGLRSDPAYGHLQWAEITRPVQARQLLAGVSGGLPR